MVKQTLKFLAVSLFFVFLWFSVHALLERWHHPAETAVLDILKVKLTPNDSVQRKLLKETVAKYPLESLFAAYRSGWEGIEDLWAKGPDYALTVSKMAFHPGSMQVDKETAIAFIGNTTKLLETFAALDPDYGKTLLKELKKLGFHEYRNIAWDPSYIMIAPRLVTDHRELFRKNQEVLTPLLTMTDPADWTRVMDSFADARPRIDEIIRDPELDDRYAWSYLLNRDLVMVMIDQGFSEAEAVRFLELNSQTTGDAMKNRPKWAEELGQARFYPAVSAESGQKMSLFDWACADPSIYWILTHDTAPDNTAIFLVLTRYAGTELPSILQLHYSSNSRLLQAALDSLKRFDNENDPNPDKRNTASRFLNHYQDDERFKSLLAIHGALLIPALAIGGEQELDHIARNPGNILKHIDEEGNPRSTWWQYIPGGSIVAVIRDLTSGRSVTAGEWGWAAFDAVTLVALTATSIKAISSARGLRAAQPVGRTLSAGGLGATVAKKGAWSQVKLRALPILAATGKVARKSVAALFTIVRKHPVKSLVGALAVYYFLKPEALTKHAGKIGQIAAALPVAVVSGLWDQIAEELNRSPFLSFFYYPLLILFSLLVISVILAALKHFLRPVWDMFVLILRPFLLLFGKRKAKPM